ncbi:MAG: hypothetical protein U1F08_12435 [Steroidobacteraceae bacterium]
MAEYPSVSPPPGPPGRDLARCAEVSICDLSGAEQFLVWAIRWRTSAQDDAEFAEECLTDSFSRAGMPDALPALREFVCAACPMQLDCPASRRLGCWRLNRLEAHALHAVACLQAGLLGEAWLTLRAVVPDASVPAALESLQALGEAVVRSGGTIRRWAGSPALTATRH